MTRQTTQSLEEFLPVVRITLRLGGKRGPGQCILPDERRYGLDLISFQPEAGHLCPRPERLRVLQPNRYPLLVELELDVFQIRTKFFLVFHQVLRLDIELID